MQRTNHLITITLIASMAVGGVALGMEGNPRYNTGEALQKLLNPVQKVPATSVVDYQKSQNDAKKTEFEAKKKEILAWYEAQKKIIQTEADAARVAFTEKANALSPEEKAALKDTLYAQYKQIGIDTESKLNSLKTEKEGKLKELEAQYKNFVETEKKVKNEMSSEVEAKKKELNTWFETQKKQIVSAFEEKKAYLYSKRNALTEEEKKTQKTLFDETKTQLITEFEAKKKELQSQFESKMNEIKSQYGIPTGTKEVSSVDKEKAKQELKDKLAKVQGEKKPENADLAQCKASFETQRTAKETNAKERKAAWDAFWETNKGAQKDLFLADSKEDVKDTLDTMWLQIRLVERKYVKSLVGTSSTVTLEYALSTIDSIAKRTRTDLADYVQDGKGDQFNTFRDGFIAVLNTNKKSLLTLMQAQSQTIKGLADVCKKKAQATLIVQDSSDKQTQGLLNANVNGSVGEKPSESK